MNYCVAVWGSSSKGNTCKISSSLNRALKILNVYNSGDVYMNFSSTYKYFVTLYMYKYSIEGKSLYFNHKFSQLAPSHIYGTRFNNCDLLNIPIVRKSIYQNNFFYQAIISWNELPLELRKCTTMLRFKKKVKSYFLTTGQL